MILSVTDHVTNADPNTSGAVFWPAGGFRRGGENGTVNYIGSQGNYWFSTASASGNGHYLAFDATTIYPQTSHFRYYGFPVRCIRD